MQISRVNSKYFRIPRSRSRYSQSRTNKFENTRSVDEAKKDGEKMERKKERKKEKERALTVYQA